MKLTDADRARIAEAIRAAELRTSGEIYCVIMQVSSRYRLVPTAWAALLALILPLPLIYGTDWPAAVIYGLQLLTFIGVAMGLSHQSMRFRLVTKRTKHDRAHAEAVRQFLAHGLQNTEHRTGVLIFVSIAERYAEVLADAGIDRKVSQQVWDDAVRALTREVKDDRLADGFVAAIGLCADVLAEHFPPGAINRDELPNAIVEL